MVTGLAKHFPWMEEKRRLGTSHLIQIIWSESNVNEQINSKMFIIVFEMLCISDSVFTLPNVLIRFHFTFPDHRPQSGQGVSLPAVWVGGSGGPGA